MIHLNLDLKKYHKRLKKFYQKYIRFLPWLSFAWGIFSSFLVTRNYSSAFKLSLYASFFIIFIGILSFWYVYISSLSKRNSKELKIFQTELIQRRHLIEYIGSIATQFFVQYILLFCLPFLYLKGNPYWTISFAIPALITLWDPLWNHLISSLFFRQCLRVIACIVSISFIYPIFFPKHLNHFYFWLECSAIFGAIPWEFIFLHKKKYIYSFVTFFILFIIIIAHGFMKSTWKFPVLSIWVKKPYFSFDRYNNHDKYKDSINYISFKSKLKQSEGLCAITPIMAPFGIHIPVIQKWYLNNQLIEEITLPDIFGHKNDTVYTTYSCKKNFPNIKANDLICVVSYLYGDLFIGSHTLYLAPSNLTSFKSTRRNSLYAKH